MIKVQYQAARRFGETAYPGDAGIDLPIVGEHILSPGESKDIPSGIKLAIPEKYYGRITGRSSALRKRNIKVHEGIIDSGFRGELFSYVTNESSIATSLSSDDRVAQLIIQPVVEIQWEPTKQLPASTRGEQGFGSSDSPDAKLFMNRFFGKNATVDLMGSEWIERESGDNLYPLVYLGGPIDNAKDGGNWRPGWTATLVRSGYRVFDPQAEAAGMLDPEAIWVQNMAAMASADVCLFNLGWGEAGVYGFGSPIEIYEAVKSGRRVIVVHKTNTIGVYLRKLWLDGAVIVPDLAAALTEMQQVRA